MPTDAPERRGRARWRRSPLLFAVTGAAVLAPTLVHAQVDPAPAPGSGRIRVVPGAIYGAGGVYRALMGSGFRDLWLTAIEVPLADLGTIGGGAVPVRVGGGVSTKTLHLDGADGRRYVFRSVDKTPTELLDDFAGSALEDIIQDQMSSFHPTAAPIVARLLEAVGVLHPEPSFLVVPDDPRLGEFREQFAGMLVLFEERPDDGPEGGPGFAASRRIVQTDDLFDILEEGPEHRLDAEDLLRSRLVDLLVGDRDRSHNNHLWARFEDGGGGYRWRVIPRDRDQAFVRFDGALMGLARIYERRFVTFRAAYPDIEGLTRNAWDIDRTLLVGLDRATWDRVVAQVVRRIDDRVIDEALRRMPREHHALVGAELGEALRARRDHLPEAAEALYRIVFSNADVHVTDADEEVVVDRLYDGSVSVTVRPAGGPPSYARAFAPDETEEVRLYLHGGDDVVHLRGDGPRAIRVRVVGGGGTDRFVDEGGVGHAGTTVYDGDDDTTFPASGSAEVQRRNAPRPYAWWFEDGRTLDWGSLTIPEPGISYDEDRGLVLSAGLRHDRYEFLKRPYGTRVRLQAGWAFGARKPLLRYRQLFRQVASRADVRLEARWSGIELLNFYGFGNDAPGDAPFEYHRIAHEEGTASVAVAFGDGERRTLEVGPVLTFTSTDTTGATSYLAEVDPYGGGSFTWVGIEARAELDGRDRVGTPTRGLRLSGTARFVPEVLDATRGAFGGVAAQVAGYLSPPGGNPVLALRASGEHLWGRYPFTRAAYLGGPSSLRGLREQRYAGDASALGSAELRVELGRIRFPLPADVGVLALADAGRVFRDGSPGGWHTGLGGGLWFALVNRSNVLRITAARSEGETRLYAGVGFAY